MAQPPSVSAAAYAVPPAVASGSTTSDPKMSRYHSTLGDRADSSSSSR